MNFDKLIGSLIYLLIVLAVYLVLSKALKTVFLRAQRKKGASSSQAHRLKTIHEMLQSILRYIALILLVLTVLANLGVNVTSILAGLGIMAAIMGLAFQDMLKDVIAGVMFIVENQFSVGDMVKINGFSGEVISMSLKTTRVQNSKGEVMILANHNIDGLINCSKGE